MGGVEGDDQTREGREVRKLHQVRGRRRAGEMEEKEADIWEREGREGRGERDGWEERRAGREEVGTEGGAGGVEAGVVVLLLRLREERSSEYTRRSMTKEETGRGREAEGGVEGERGAGAGEKGEGVGLDGLEG